MNKTGLVWHELYMWHDTGNHYESPEPKRRIKNLLDATEITELLIPIKPRYAKLDELALVHTTSHIDKIEKLIGKTGNSGDPETVIGHASVQIAKLAVGGVIEAIKAVDKGDVENAYALIRPPGHHAESNSSLGFCIYANAAIGIKYALEKLGYSKIAIVDWDVHHGNGTEECFSTDPRVLTISLHQDGLYPLHSGNVDFCGLAKGVGKNINIPLLEGSGEGAYLYAFEKIVLPALNNFKPELLLVACGFDSSVDDPLGRMLLHSDSYRILTTSLMNIANKYCQRKIVFTHEGGYNPNTTPFLGLAVIETLLDHKTNIVEPNLIFYKSINGQKLRPFQKEWIDNLVTEIKKHPNSLLNN